jgi:protein TonB
MLKQKFVRMKSTTIIIFLFFLIAGVKASAQDNVSLDKAANNQCLAHDTIVQVAVEKSATFEEGDLIKFRTYVMKNIQYPVEAQVAGYSGKPYIQFVVDWDGQVKDVTVLRSSGYKILDDEAVRVIKKSPLWTSAKTNNVCVPQQFVLPLSFKSLGIISISSGGM